MRAFVPFEANPQTWNRYAYVGNNPLGNVDPLGLDCTTASGESCGDSGTPFITKNVSAPYYPGGWWDLAFEGWPGTGSAQSFFCMLMGGCNFGNGSSGSSGGGGATQPQPPAQKPNPQPSKSLTNVARCAAQFSSDHSLAAGLEAATGGAVSQRP